MNTLIVLLALLAFFLMYNTSNRVKQTTICRLGVWAGKNPATSRYLAMGILALTLVLSMIHYGAFSGFFAFGAALMLVSSVTLLLMPLKLVKPLTALIIFGLLMSVEFVLI